MSSENRYSIFLFDIDELRDFFSEVGVAKYAADQVFDWLYRKFEHDPNCWSNVSKKVRNLFPDKLDLSLPSVDVPLLSIDGTRKFLLTLADGESVEAVSIPGPNRTTLCISSQVGCAIGCTFCLTGTMGLTRNLTIDEIVGQFMAVVKWMRESGDLDYRPTNIVYMGQGEPLHNYENVKQATKIFLQPKGLGIGQRKLTLSTSGLAPAIEKLADFPPVNIAVSLHASRDDVRDELMPINKVYDLKRLFQAIKTIPLKAHRWITFEYLLIKDMNDGEEDIAGLVTLLGQTFAKINIIPFNEFPGCNFKRPSSDKVDWFRDKLIKAGFTCTVRMSKGSDILAACGQLKSQYQKKGEDK